MKYTTLSLLLLITILTMSMATLFTACPKPEPEAGEKDPPETMPIGETTDEVGTLPASTCDGKPWISKQWCVTTLATGFNAPRGIAAATDGTAYVVDKNNYRIKQVTKDGTVNVIAGSGEAGKEDGDGIGIAAQFDNPKGIALAPDGNMLYVADIFNKRIRTIALSSPYTVSTIPVEIESIWVVASPDALYTAKDASNIRKIALSSPYTESTIAMSGRPIFITTTNVALAKNALYIGGIIGGTSPDDPPPVYEIRKVSLSGGSNRITKGFLPSGLALATDGTLYVADQSNRIRKITFNPMDGSLKALTTIAGDGTAGRKDGVGIDAQFNGPTGIAVAKDKDGNTILYVVDTNNNSIRKLEYKE